MDESLTSSHVNTTEVTKQVQTSETQTWTPNDGTQTGEAKMEDTSSLPSSPHNHFMVKVDWPKDILPQKRERELQVALQSYLKKSHKQIIFSVIKITDDGMAEIMITSSALKDLRHLGEITVNFRNHGPVPICFCMAPNYGTESSVDDPSSLLPVSQNPVLVKVDWPKDLEPQKREKELQDALDSWFKSHKQTSCTVLNITDDGMADKVIDPPSVVKDLHNLGEIKLTSKDLQTVPIHFGTAQTGCLSVDDPSATSLVLQNTRPTGGNTTETHPNYDGTTRTRYLSVDDTSAMPSTPHNTQPTIKNNTENSVMVWVDWPKDIQPQKRDIKLENPLQTWFNKHIRHTSCKVVKSTDDGMAEILISPSSSIKELHKFRDITLNFRDHGPVPVRFHMTLNDGTPTGEAKVEDPSSLPSGLQNVEPQEKAEPPLVGPGGQNTSNTVTLAASTFCYLSQAYKKEIECIEKENGVQINLKVSFIAAQAAVTADPEKALEDFTELTQRCLADCTSITHPLKAVDLSSCEDTLRIFQKDDAKLLLSVCSEEVTVSGPRTSLAAVKMNMKLLPNASTGDDHLSVGSVRGAHGATQKISTNIKDPLIDGGVPMDEHIWNLMTSSKMADIEAKFGVRFQPSRITQGKVTVRAKAVKSPSVVEADSMESHALSALVRLYQKVATSQHNGVTRAKIEGATAGGATGQDEEDKCPICLDAFTNKTKLKCGHALCKECLFDLEKNLGPVCPICKDVFGKVEGNQPDGTMSTCVIKTSLPGFNNCGTITINYCFPSGTQTEKHPSPGSRYHGTTRVAYLPDNKEGREVLRLLRKAFDQRFVFTVGTSTTTGAKDQVTWNDIHHKTSPTGGPQSFGYPDSDYMKRVREELKAKGIE